MIRLTNAFTLGIKGIIPVLLHLIDEPFLYSLGVIIGSIITFLFGTQIIMYAFFGLLTLDAITGWLKARQNGHKPDSQTLGVKTFSKLMAYLIVIIAVALLGLVACSCPILIPLFQGLQIFVIWWILSRETISILENLNAGFGSKIPAIHHIYLRIVGLAKKADDKIDQYLEFEEETEEKTEVK